MQNKKSILRFFIINLLLISLFVIAVFSIQAAEEPEYNWKFSVPFSRQLWTETTELFADLVKFYTDGRMEIKVYPNEIIGNHDETFHGVQQGSIEIGLLAPYVNLVPGGMVNWMPWTIENYNQSAVAFNNPDGILFKVISKAWEEVGFHFLFNCLEGSYGFGNSVRPIKAPEDFKNLKMRVSSSLGLVRAMENFGKGTGMTLATLPWTEIYNALERGVVDGCWSQWPSMVEERHYEVMKYYTTLDWVWGTNNVVVNKEKWDELPSEIQDSIIKAAKLAEIRDYEMHRREDLVFRKRCVENGLEVYDPTIEEKAVFREKSNMPAIWEELCEPWLEKNYPGENMTEKIIFELERINNEFPY